jgi:molybdopterin synthase catalytic subunit
MANSLCEVLLTEARLEALKEDVDRPAFGGQLLQKKSRRNHREKNRKSWATQPIDTIGCPSGAKRVDLGAGAIVEFLGVVRALEEKREIEGIDYEAHRTMAEHQMKLIAQNAIEKFSLAFVILHHRTGFVAAGEASLLLRVGSRHRAAAFQASEWIVDELKRKVPIWKRPRLRQGYGAAGADSPEPLIVRK